MRTSHLIPIALAGILGVVASVATGRADEEQAAARGGPETVTIETSDGLTLRGSYWAPADMPQGAPCVVALHMYRSDRSAWEPVAGPITARGGALLAIDMRGHGDSRVQGEEDLSEKVVARDAELFNAMHLDAEAAIAWARKVKRVPRGRVALLGASVGCSVAIQAATKKPLDIAAVAVLTPGKEYLGVPTMEHVEHWYETLPLRIFSSAEERGNGADAIHTALATKGCELTIVPGTGIHGTRMFGQVPGLEDDLAAWLTARLLGPIPDGVIEDSEIEGAVTGTYLGRDLFVRFVNGRLYVATRRTGAGGISNDTVRLRVSDASGEVHDIAADTGMGMNRIDMSFAGGRPESSATTETSLLPGELGVAPGATIGVQLTFDDDSDGDPSFGPAERLRITLE